jgi:hypothetical protein
MRCFGCRWGLALGAAVLLGAAAAWPAAAETTQSLTLTAVVVNQQCLGGDFVAVVLSAQVNSTSQPVVFRWDLNNDGTLDTPVRPRPLALGIYPDEALVTARVVARNAEGDLAQDTVTFGTLRCV